METLWNAQWSCLWFQNMIYVPQTQLTDCLQCPSSTSSYWLWDFTATSGNFLSKTFRLVLSRLCCLALFRKDFSSLSLKQRNWCG